MSLHPFFTDTDSVFEKSLIGTWTDKSGKATLAFKQFGANAYRVTYVQLEMSTSPGGKKQSGDPGEFEGHVGRIDGVSQLLLAVISLEIRPFVPVPFLVVMRMTPLDARDP